MQLSALSWSLFGCALYIFGTSLGYRGIPSSQEIENLEHEDEEVFSQRKELDNDPIVKGESVNAPDAANEDQPHIGNQELRIDDTDKNTWGFGFIVDGAKGSLHSNYRIHKRQECPNVTSITCDPTAMYRTFDGSCNNLRQPHLGQAGSCHRRILAAEYDDNREKPKTYNNTLPDARDVCILLHRDSPRCDNCFDRAISAMFMSFGQFVDHDLTFTRPVALPNNTPIACCPIRTTNNRECFPIRLRNDSDFGGSNCMNFTRSTACQQCVVEQRQQINVLTPFMDCSHIYGLTADESRLLRGGRTDGKLDTFRIGTMELLPQNLNASPQCGSICFRTGDTRSNQNPLLTMLHTVYLRFHNIVVDELKSYNKRWGAEKLFLEARKFLIACFQHITYGEYLPIALGDDAMSRYGLSDNPTRYDDRSDPRTINEAMAAAFRFHSTVMDYFLLKTEDGKEEMIPLAKNFFNVTPFYMGKLEGIAMGSTRQPQMEFDPLLVESVMRFLYVRSNATPPALDLCSVNIQRGRDHGLPGYTTYVRFFFGIDIKSFGDDRLKDFLRSDCISKYKNLYRSVHHIDLWSALQCEILGSNGLVGKVATLILVQQFGGTKYGDRFFWTHTGESWSLTYQERRAVQAMTLARILCEALAIKMTSKFPFFHDSPQTRCDDYNQIPKMDLSMWGI